MGNTYNNTVSGGTVHGNVGQTEYHKSPVSYSASDSGKLDNLSDIQNHLEEIADALGDLREAVQEQNQPGIEKTVQKLSGGVAVSVLGSVATGGVRALLRNLGIPLP